MIRDEIANKLGAKHCDCGDVGFYVVANYHTGEPEQEQCAFCYTENSYFMVDEILSLCKQVAMDAVEEDVFDHPETIRILDYLHDLACGEGDIDESILPYAPCKNSPSEEG